MGRAYQVAFSEKQIPRWNWTYERFIGREMLVKDKGKRNQEQLVRVLVCVKF